MHSAQRRSVASGFSASLRATPGRPLRCRSTAGGSAFAFCPREGGTEELSGVFGGPPSLASNSAMRAFNAFTCASNSSMRSSLAAICASSWSIRANSGATRRAPSLFGESFFLCAMASVNQLAAVGSTPQTRVTTPQKVSSYPKFAKAVLDMRKVAEHFYSPPDVERILDYVVANRSVYSIIVMNSERDATVDFKSATNPASLFTFVIGGNIVSRGVTFDNLLSMFFTRDVKNKLQQDTYIQRARMFGSRGSYLAHFELTIPKKL